MAHKSLDLPPTMPCPEMGRMQTRDTPPFTVRYKGQDMTVDYYPEGDGESVHVGADMAAAGHHPSHPHQVAPEPTRGGGAVQGRSQHLRQV